MKAITTIDKIPSTPAVVKLYKNEYNATPMPGGANSPKNTTPDKKLTNTDTMTANNDPIIALTLLSLPNTSANPSAIVAKI